MRHLMSQGIKNIDSYQNEKDLLDKTKEFYNNYNSIGNEEKDLKEKIVLLENRKINISNMTFITEMSILITLSLALITSYNNFANNVGKIESNFITLQEKVQSEIDYNKNVVEESNDKLGIYEDKQEYYSNKIENSLKEEQKLRDDFKSKGDSAKKDISDELDTFFLIFRFVGIFMTIIVLEWLIFKPYRTVDEMTKNIAINIHKSVIEERLKECNYPYINKLKYQNKK
jgi:hypothetical protein